MGKEESLCSSEVTDDRLNTMAPSQIRGISETAAVSQEQSTLPKAVLRERGLRARGNDGSRTHLFGKGKRRVTA